MVVQQVHVGVAAEAVVDVEMVMLAGATVCEWLLALVASVKQPADAAEAHLIAREDM